MGSERQPLAVVGVGSRVWRTGVSVACLAGVHAMKPKAKTARERIEALIDRYIPPAGMYLPENDANAAYLVGLRVALSCLPPTPPRRKGKKK